MAAEWKKGTGSVASEARQVPVPFSHGATRHQISEGRCLSPFPTERPANLSEAQGRPFS